MKKSPMTLGSWRRMAGALAVGAVAFGMTACGKTEDATVGQRIDSAVGQTEQAAAEARVKTEEMMKNAGQKVEQGAANTSEAMKDAANTAIDAVDDASITAKVKAGLAADAELSAIQINVDTVNGKVTLKGPAVNATAKERAETIAKAVKGVNAVHNELTVSPS